MTAAVAPRRSVEVLLAPPFAAPALHGAHVVAIDVLRATTTIATALANGAAGVIPVLEPEDAVAIAERLGRERVLLCGERGALRIPGFDLGNSPASYPRAVVAGKVIVFTTTNGTRALRAAPSAASLRAGAIANRAAVADALALEEGDVVLLCAGAHGRFALEDALGAGALVEALLARVPGVELHDGAQAAAQLYRAAARRLVAAVTNTYQARVLEQLGFGADLARCAALDALDVVPVLRDGMLVAARKRSLVAAA